MPMRPTAGVSNFRFLMNFLIIFEKYIEMPLYNML